HRARFVASPQRRNSGSRRDELPVTECAIAQVRSRSRRLDCMAMRPIVATGDSSRPLTAEPQLVDLLDGLEQFGIVTFHDRRIKRSFFSIDHVIVAPSGVYAVDAHPWSGRVEVHE